MCNSNGDSYASSGNLRDCWLSLCWTYAPGDQLHRLQGSVSTRRPLIDLMPGAEGNGRPGGAGVHTAVPMSTSPALGRPPDDDLEDDDVSTEESEVEGDGLGRQHSGFLAAGAAAPLTGVAESPPQH